MNQNTVLIMVFIMVVASFVLGYFINETISIKNNITNNMHKFYMALFMAMQMGIIELLMHMYMHNYITQTNLILLTGLSVVLLYTGYKLVTLNFLDDKQFLLAMIEHHENALAMSNSLLKQSNNSEVRQLANQIIKSQQEEIDYMNTLLK